MLYSIPEVDSEDNKVLVKNPNSDCMSKDYRALNILVEVWR